VWMQHCRRPCKIQMLAIKNSADDGRYGSATRNLSGGRLVRCPNCNEVYVVYATTAALVNRAYSILLQRLSHECPHHVEFIAADEAA